MNKHIRRLTIGTIGILIFIGIVYTIDWIILNIPPIFIVPPILLIVAYLIGLLLDL